MCKTEFSNMKVIKSEYRATISNDFLECLRLVVGENSPDYNQLANEMECRYASTSTIKKNDIHFYIISLVKLGIHLYTLKFHYLFKYVYYWYKL